jgi:hypothetical protein
MLVGVIRVEVNMSITMEIEDGITSESADIAKKVKDQMRAHCDRKVVMEQDLASG